MDTEIQHTEISNQTEIREKIDESDEKKETPEDNPDFQSLLPEYQKYKRECQENPSSIEVPLAHGTGSYALKRILKDGFAPSKHVGENSSYVPRGEDKTLSLATLDTMAGEMAAHFYATQSSQEIGSYLAFNSDKYIKGNNRVDNYVDSAHGGIENLVEQKLNEFHFNNGLERQKGREEIDKDLKYRLGSLKKTGAFIFKPEDAEESIRNANLLVSGIKVDTEIAGAILRDLNLFYAVMTNRETRETIRPDLTEETLKRSVEEIKDEDNWLRKEVIKRKEQKEKLLEEYKNMSDDEKQEIEGQFPCYIVLEGKGIELKDPKRTIQEERHARSEEVGVDRIREIQVPQGKIPDVEQWIKEAGLEGIRIVPFEFYEMQQALEATAKAVYKPVRGNYT